jgi:hypothetical protein
VGKFFGLVLTMTAIFVVLSIAFTLIVWWGMWTSITDYQGVYPERKAMFWTLAWQASDEMWRGMVFCLLQVLVLSGVALACCVRAPMIVSVVIFFMAFVLGHFAGDIAGAAQRSGTLIGSLGAVVLAGVIPDLNSLNFSQEAGSGQVISLALVGWGLLYAAGYAAAMVLLALALFRNREVI